jgi:hypothetical protein
MVGESSATRVQQPYYGAGQGYGQKQLELQVTYSLHVLDVILSHDGKEPH